MKTRNSPLRQLSFLESEDAAILYVDERVDKDGSFRYLDRVGSVSALVEVEDDCEYDPEHVLLNRREIRK